MVQCKSSQMSEHGYDSVNNTLAVRFKSGGLYHYKGVPKDVYDKMLKAESFGKFFHANIKAKFKHQKQGK